MKNNIMDAVIAGAEALVGFLFGQIDGLFYALIAFIVLDYISGVIVAVINKKLSSEVGFKGICKKVLLLSIVALGNIIDVQVIGNGSTLRTAVIFVFLANEGISLIENAAGIGLPIPKPIINALEQLKRKSDGGNKDE
ncbi:MAG: holin family protein [Ruminiclostridium sp.]